MRHQHSIVHLCPMLSLVLLFWNSLACADTAVEVRALTGAHTRVVWLQDAAPEKPCVYSERPTLRLMGFDTEDGKGERALLPTIGSYVKPLLTADGSRVLFGDAVANTVCMVKWDGSGLTTLVKNAVFEDVWTDPRNGVEWIYATTREKRGEATVPVIRRYRLHDPTRTELVWDKMPLHMFMLAGDGRAASGGGDGGNSPQGLFTLPNDGFAQMAGGCWPSMSPDASHRMWVFTGNHRTVNMFAPDREGKAYAKTCSFENVPGLKGYHELYHPRWSNDIRFLALTGPYAYSDWRWSSDTKISPEGAAGVEVFLGKFNDDFTGVVQWVAVTHNTRGDYWPDSWVAPDPRQPILLPAPEPAPRPAAAATSDARGLVFQWGLGSTGNQVTDPVTGAIRQCAGQFRDLARPTRFGAVDLTGGAFLPTDTDAPLLSACKASDQVSLELTFTPTSATGVEEGTVLAFATATQTNLRLFQRGDWLHVTLNTAGPHAPEVPLCRVTAGRPHHLMLSYAPGRLTGVLNGRRVLVRQRIQGGLKSWTAGRLIVGDTWDGGHPWSGVLEGLALFSRALELPEAQARWAVRESKVQGRLPAAQLVVDATLTGRTQSADPKAIAPYRRCLSVNRFAVAKVIAGRCEEKVLDVAQWSVLDARVVSGYEKLEKGRTYRLTLERWEDHPEQESERMMTGDVEDVDVPLFLDVTPLVLPQPPVKAVEVAWRGGDGAWETTNNWTTGVAPTARDAATLGPVLQGTRIVSTSRPVMLRQLTVTSPQAGALNQLRLGEALTLAGSAKPFVFSTAGVAGLVLDLNGQALDCVNDTLNEVTFAGTVLMRGNGTVAAVTALEGGGGYTRAPQVTFTGVGQGAVAEATMSVEKLTLTALGAQYKSAPAVTLSPPEIAGGRQAQAQARINPANGALAAVTITDPGSGYVRAPTVTFSGGDGDGAAADATLSLTEIVVTHGGNGYATPPAVVFTGGDGTGAQAQAATQRTVLRYTGRDGGLTFTNTGLLEQDGAALLFDWAATERNGARRGFVNTGTWTLQHGACVRFMSSTNQPFWFGHDNTNSGTLRVLSGARLGLSNLTTAGTLELGADVLIGQPEFAQNDGTLTNSGKGVLTIAGSSPAHPSTFGCIGPSNGKRIVNNGTATPENQARLLVGTGEDAAVLAIRGGQCYLNNAAGSRVEIRPGATLALLTSDNGSSHRFNNRDAKVTNAGSLLLAGSLVLQGNHGGAVMLDNAGTFTVTGAQATIERLRSSCGPGGFYNADTAAKLVVRPGAVLQGAGILTYRNSTENAEARALLVAAAGTLAPGTGPASLGRLEMRAANLTLTGTIAIDVGGQPSMPSDLLALTGEGDAGQVTLTAGSTLDLTPLPGVTPHGTYRILTAKKVVGRFEKLHFRGLPEVPYTVSYLADGVEVVFP
jgi:hypothetical protein